MEEESFAQALWQYTKKTTKDILEWLKPDPADHLVVKIVKGIFKSVVALFMIAFSPIVAIFLFFAFLGAF